EPRGPVHGVEPVGGTRARRVLFPARARGRVLRVVGLGDAPRRDPRPPHLRRGHLDHRRQPSPGNPPHRRVLRGGARDPRVRERGAWTQAGRIAGVIRILAALALAAIATLARADANGLLYDPQPPANSAYVRVVNVAPGSAMDVSVDGRARLRGIAPGEASDYLVLPAGKRALAIAPAG